MALIIQVIMCSSHRRQRYNFNSEQASFYDTSRISARIDAFYRERAGYEKNVQAVDYKKEKELRASDRGFDYCNTCTKSSMNKVLMYFECMPWIIVTKYSKRVDKISSLRGQ